MSTYTPISTQTLSANAATVVFSGIPQTYTDLVLVCSARIDQSGNSEIYGRFNSDSGSNYSWTQMTGNGSTTSSGRATNDVYINLGQGSGTSSAAGTFAVSINHIMNYSNTTTNKTIITRQGDANNVLRAAAGLWRSTAAINTITIYGNAGGGLVSGSTFTLYGIGAGSPKAFGGDEVTTDGTYWYHTYRSSGIFAPMQNLSCDYVVVAGGGGGAAGGSGAGGFKTSIGGSPLSLIAGSNNTVTIGGGGTGATLSYGASTAGRTKGTNSVFSTITATGGGGAGAGPDAAGGGTDTNLSGGSGGGATYSSGVGKYGTGISGEGNNGGQDVFNNPPYSGAGGGGAGAVGQNNQSDSVAGNGGAGTFNAITNAALVGQLSGGNYYLAGGGGGGIYGLAGSGTGGTGGLGGGGNGCNGTSGTDVGQNGTANTGGGAGGSSADATGRAGGSGVVIVRYLV
jgi:hypothetical protein